MKKIKIIFLIIGFFNSPICYGQSEYVILSDQKRVDELISSKNILAKSAKTVDLTKKEFNLLEKLLKKSIDSYNSKLNESAKNYGRSEQFIELYQIGKLKNYMVQYVPYLNDEGQKEVWINGFCNQPKPDWKTQIIYFLDGGNCIFNIRINLKTEKCLSIEINNIA